MSGTALAHPHAVLALSANLGFSIGIYDIAGNIAGFAAVGIVLGGLGFLRAIVAGALISTVSEFSQLFMAHRDPSAIDVISNVVGTGFGAAISIRWRLRSPSLIVGPQVTL